MKISISPLFLLFLTLILVASIPNQTSYGYTFLDLGLTVVTDQESYYPLPGTSIRIYGNLTLNQTQVTDGLVAILVRYPNNDPYVIRTVDTGTIPPTTPYVKLKSIIPCDSEGNPKNSFLRGGLAYFKLTVINYDIFEPHEALLTVNTYDPNNIPFCSATFKVTLQPDTITPIILSIPIPSDATTGDATAYGNAYTEWPSLGGTPHCPEKSATFQITPSSSYQSSTTLAGQNPAFSSLQTDENYNTTFNISPKTPVGTYNVYVSSRYEGITALNSTTFKILWLGDFDKDNDIDINDIRYFCRAYIDYWNTGVCDPICDFDQDGDIDINDTRTFVRQYIDYWNG